MISSLMQAAATTPNPELTGGAIAFMVVSIAAVSGLTIWCFARVLAIGKREGGKLQ
jgi:hypothetical protein